MHGNDWILIGNTILKAQDKFYYSDSDIYIEEIGLIICGYGYAWLDELVSDYDMY